MIRRQHVGIIHEISAGLLHEARVMQGGITQFQNIEDIAGESSQLESMFMPQGVMCELEIDDIGSHKKTDAFLHAGNVADEFHDGRRLMNERSMDALRFGRR